MVKARVPCFSLASGLFGHEAVGTHFGSVARLAGAMAMREKALAKRANRKRVFMMGLLMGSITGRGLCFLGGRFGFGDGEGGRLL
jgi:hypothetical protein